MSVSPLRRDPIKANGVHYTPPELAAFLAEGAVRQANFPQRSLIILDPACGDGQLLAALAEALPKSRRQQAQLVGYDRDADAVSTAVCRLRAAGVANVDIRHEDFLETVLDRRLNSTDDGFADVVISNPPYVRTQTLGARRSRKLATQFQLTGRTDLYQAFMQAMTSVLRVGGVLSLLTSNRFMLTQSGASVRQLLRTQFTLRELYDLGDTRLFAAAVLPAILIARRETPTDGAECKFVRIYQESREDRPKKESTPPLAALPGLSLPKASASEGRSPKSSRQYRESLGLRSSLALRAAKDPNSPSIIAALRDGTTGTLATTEGVFRIERGELGASEDPTGSWSLTTPLQSQWLSAIHHRRQFIVDDIARVRVGVKTTADKVFIRDDWETLPVRQRPEPELLRPLLTHQVAARWSADIASTAKRILYPYAVAEDGSRTTLDIREYPRARAYLQQHRRQLEARTYLREAGRHWYEIWVPQQPKDWLLPKVVYPDIADRPRFFLDRSAAVVNGDCYWMTLKPGIEMEWLLLLTAMANSSLATRYYDAVFHNKLYAGRRRYMTQYVRQFPLPNIDAPAARNIIERLSSTEPVSDDDDLRLDRLVEESFER